MSGSNAKESSSAAAAASAPCGLWAASSTIVGLRRMTSSRPGEVTSAKRRAHEVARRAAGRRRTPRRRPARPRRSGPGARRTAAGRPRRSGRAAPAARRPGRRPRGPARRRRTRRPRGRRSRRPRRARRSSTSATSGVCSASTAVAPGLMIPAFSSAIVGRRSRRGTARGRPRSAARRRPGRRRRWWRPTSRPCRPRRRPRRPARRRTRRTPCRRWSRRTTAGGPRSASTRWVYGATSLNARTNSSSVERLAVDADPLAHPLDVGAGEPAGAQVQRPQQGVDHPRGRRLAVGAGQVDDRVGALRVAEQLGEGADPVERRLEPGLGPAGQQGVLDLGEGLGRGGRCGGLSHLAAESRAAPVADQQVRHVDDRLGSRAPRRAGSRSGWPGR